MIGPSYFGSKSEKPDTGTAAKRFCPSLYDECQIRNGQPSPISCQIQCITLMNDYANKSLEELRLEDYMLAKNKNVPVSNLRNVVPTSPFPAFSFPNFLVPTTSRQNDSSGNQTVSNANAVRGMPSNDLPTTPNRETLIKLLECPVCLETCCPPVFLCRVGHRICKICRPKVTSCPICRGSFVGTRDLGAEELFRELKLVEPPSSPAPAFVNVVRPSQTFSFGQPTVVLSGRIPNFSIGQTGSSQNNSFSFTFGQPNSLPTSTISSNLSNHYLPSLGSFGLPTRASVSPIISQPLFGAPTSTFGNPQFATQQQLPGNRLVSVPHHHHNANHSPQPQRLSFGNSSTSSLAPTLPRITFGVTNASSSSNLNPFCFRSAPSHDPQSQNLFGNPIRPSTVGAFGGTIFSSPSQNSFCFGDLQSPSLAIHNNSSSFSFGPDIPCATSSQIQSATPTRRSSELFTFIPTCNYGVCPQSTNASTNSTLFNNGLFVSRSADNGSNLLLPANSNFSGFGTNGSMFSFNSSLGISASNCTPTDVVNAVTQPLTACSSTSGNPRGEDQSRNASVSAPAEPRNVFQNFTFFSPSTNNVTSSSTSISVSPEQEEHSHSWY